MVFLFSDSVSRHIQNQVRRHATSLQGDHSTGGILQGDNCTGGKYLFKLQNSRHYFNVGITVTNDGNKYSSNYPNCITKLSFKMERNIFQEIIIPLLSGNQIATQKRDDHQEIVSTCIGRRSGTFVLFSLRFLSLLIEIIMITRQKKDIFISSFRALELPPIKFSIVIRWASPARFDTS